MKTFAIRAAVHAIRAYVVEELQGESCLRYALVLQELAVSKYVQLKYVLILETLVVLSIQLFEMLRGQLGSEWQEQKIWWERGKKKDGTGFIG